MFGHADSQASSRNPSLAKPGDSLAATAPESGRWFNVLVVDSDPAIAARLCQTLKENERTRVTLCKSGSEAARLLGLECALPALKPDLCLLAADVPGLTGVDLLTLMRRTDDLMSIPVALVMHESDDQMTHRAMDEGVNGIITARADATEYCDDVRRIADFWRRARSAV